VAAPFQLSDDVLAEEARAADNKNPHDGIIRPLRADVEHRSFTTTAPTPQQQRSARARTNTVTMVTRTSGSADQEVSWNWLITDRRFAAVRTSS
jgi:hypothetical protein